MKRPSDFPTDQQLDRTRLVFVSRACDQCGVSDDQPVQTVAFLDHEFRFVRCLRCGLVYQNPVLDRASLQCIYRSAEYWDHKHVAWTGGGTEPVMLNYYSYNDDEASHRKNAERRCRWMSRHLPPGARVLDLGCSNGLFVSVLSKNGFRAAGMDASAMMVDQGKAKYGVDIATGDFEEPWSFTGPFDAVTCFSASANFRNPSRVFANMQKNLRPGGLFFFNYGDRTRTASKLLGARLYLYRPTVLTIYSTADILTYCGKFNLRIRERFSDVQNVSLAWLFRFQRFSLPLAFLRLLRLDRASIPLRLLTSYATCAVRE